MGPSYAAFVKWALHTTNKNCKQHLKYCFRSFAGGAGGQPRCAGLLFSGTNSSDDFLNSFLCRVAQYSYFGIAFVPYAVTLSNTRSFRPVM